MSDPLIKYNPATYPLWRNVQNLHSRTRLGGVYYPIAWLLAWLLSGNIVQLLGVGLLGCAVFIGLMLARWNHSLPTEPSELNLRRWNNRHWLLILLTGLSWGLANALIINSAAFSDSQLVAIISTIAFSTAFAFSFAMQLGRGLLTIALFNAPALLVLASDWQQHRAALLTLLIYQVYLVLVSIRSHREYHAGIALEQQLLEQRNTLEQLSRTDSLTQLGNRYQFNSLFPAMVANAQRQQSPLSLVLLDIDFFKRINDELGHGAGDDCLQAFAERMRQVFRRDSDALLRLGGEEFGVLMPDTSLDQAQQLAEQFRQVLNSRDFNLQGQSKALTASLGVGCFDAQLDHSAETFFTRVDDALYRAKDEGRDRLMLA